MRARACYTSLRRRVDFGRVHAQGRRKWDALLQVRVLPRPASATADSPIRLGIIVSKKFGKAVERNRFKRVVRAAIRAIGPELMDGWDVLVLPREAHGVSMPAILSSLRGLLGALGVLAAAAHPQDAEGCP